MTDKKGFAGFEDLVSHIDGEITGVIKEPAGDAKRSETAPHPEALRPQARAVAAVVSGAPGKITGMGWPLIVGVAFVAIAAVVSTTGDGERSESGSRSAPTAEQTNTVQPVPTAKNSTTLGKEKVPPQNDTQPPKATPEKSDQSDIKSKLDWLTEMSSRLSGKVPNKDERLDILKTISYEAKRAGLDPQLILAIIDVSSDFRKYAVSADPERKGYMSVPVVWLDKIGSGKENLFHLTTNLRFGCTVFRHYLDNSGGNAKAALEKYGGPDIGKGEFARRVLAAYRQDWKYPGKPEKSAPKPMYLNDPIVQDSPPPPPAYCDIDFNIELETFGEGVTVELRSGVPGNSKVLSSKSSRGGHVGFSGLCPGKHFLAIGNGDSVSVTPTRDFEGGHRYSSRLTLQRGSGNVSSRSRGTL